MLLSLVLLAQGAAATPVPSPVPTAAPKLGGGFGQKPTTPGKARVVITEQTLAQPRRGGTFSVSGTRGAPSATAPDAEGQAKPTAADEETAWRTRVAELRAALAKAKAEYDRVDRENTVVTFGRTGLTHSVLMSMRERAIAPARAALAEAQAPIDALPEECRTTPGCQPGWIR